MSTMIQRRRLARHPGTTPRGLVAPPVLMQRNRMAEGSRSLRHFRHFLVNSLSRVCRLTMAEILTISRIFTPLSERPCPTRNRRARSHAAGNHDQALNRAGSTSMGIAPVQFWAGCQ